MSKNSLKKVLEAEIDRPLPSPTVVEIPENAKKLTITVKKTRSTVEDIREYLSDEIIDILERISYYTNTAGMTLKEACLLVEVDFDWFSKLVEENDIIRAVVTKKQLEWKKDLLLAVSTKARSGDHDLAQWMLEKRFPDEFGKKKSDGEGSQNILIAAMEFIRKQGDSTPLVSETSGRAVIIKGKADEATLKLSEILK